MYIVNLKIHSPGIIQVLYDFVPTSVAFIPQMLDYSMN